MSISEQVKELRDKADVFERSGCAVDGIVKAFREAADTIESLSTKLQTANMERSAEDCGGWIPCKERLPELEQDVLLSFRSLDVRVGYRANTDGFFYVYGEEYVAFENTLAWKPLPEPYHEP